MVRLLQLLLLGLPRWQPQVCLLRIWQHWRRQPPLLLLHLLHRLRQLLPLWLLRRQGRRLPLLLLLLLLHLMHRLRQPLPLWLLRRQLLGHEHGGVSGWNASRL